MTETGSTTATPPSAPQGGQPRRGMGSVRNMVISAVVVSLGCIAWWAFVPRSDKVTPPTVDVAGIAREIGLSQKWDPAVADGLPSGWSPVNVRLVSLSSQPKTWQAGYDAPNDGYAAVVQTKVSGDNRTSWIKAQTGSGSAKGNVTIGGVTWAKVERSDGNQRSLVRQSALSGLATVVIGTGSWSQVQQFASALKPLSKSQLSSTGPTSYSPTAAAS